MTREPLRVLRWEDPPPSEGSARAARRKPTGSKYDQIAEQLRQRPGVWAVVLESSVGIAGGLTTHIRLGQISCFTPTGDFEATSRHRGDSAVVYARYVGDEDGA